MNIKLTARDASCNSIKRNYSIQLAYRNSKTDSKERIQNQDPEYGKRKMK